MILSFTGAAAASAKLPGGGGRVRRVAVSLCLWPVVQELRSHCRQQVLMQVREVRYALSLRNKPCPVQPGVDDDLEFQLEQLFDGAGATANVAGAQICFFLRADAILRLMLSAPPTRREWPRRTAGAS